MKLHELDELIREVCPIDGICSDGRIDFKEEASSDERAAAEAVMAANIHNVSE